MHPAFPLRHLLGLLVWAVAMSSPATTWNVYFGTGGPGAQGIYRAAFDEASGRLGAASLAAET
ncbi:MAG TPA: hypothetical protein PKE47_07705, partial [Verrucomicrobiota bacterium]|nr:hypothetical protein [Verrucomicrobiota bacterium]